MENCRTDSIVSALPVFIDELCLWSHPRFVARLLRGIVDRNDAGDVDVRLSWFTRASRERANTATGMDVANRWPGGDGSGDDSSGAHGATGTRPTSKMTGLNFTAKHASQHKDKILYL